MQGMGYSKYGVSQQVGGRGQAGDWECDALHQVRMRILEQLGQLQLSASQAGQG